MFGSSVLIPIDAEGGSTATSPIEAGDSGGPCVEATLDARPNAAVVGINSRQSGSTLLWNDPTFSFARRNVDWIWSVLDPDANCSLGAAPGTCVIDGIDGSLPDADADGLPDERDLCPDFGPPVGEPCIGNHCDADGDWVGDECDAYDEGALAACDHADADGDGVPDPLDSCPTLPPGAHATTDADGDGVFDECDRCAGADDRSVDFSMDTDDDRVADACDNCGRPNPRIGVGQPNCNLDAELAACVAAGVPESECPARFDFVRGDACDETPCGDTLFAGAREGSGGALATDVIRVDAVADAVPSVAARTGFRFCRCPNARGADTIAERDSCAEPITLPSGDQVGDCNVAQAAGEYTLALEPTGWRWSTINFTAVAARGPLFPLPTGLNAEAPTNHALRTAARDDDLLARWRFEDRDVPRWISERGETIAVGPSAVLRGVLLTHQPGGPNPTDGASWDVGLSSHVTSGAVRYATPPASGGGDYVCEPSFAFSFSGQICPFCRASFPRPWALFCAPPLPFQLEVAGLRFDPSMIGIPPLPEPPPEEVWIAPAEPLAMLRPDSIRVARLAPGPDVVSAFVEIAGQLSDLRSPCPVPGQCGSPQLVASRVASDPPPFGRSGERVVLSGTRGELYVVGGRDESGALPRDAWLYDARADTWREMAVPPDMGAVISATFDATRDELIVLDQIERRVGRRTIREARFLALPASIGGAPRVIGRFVRATTNDRFSLAADVAGDLWVAASPPVGRAHVLLRLARDGDDLRVAGFRPGAGRLAAGDSLRVDPLGATLVLEDRRRGVTPTGVRHRDLIRLPGAAERCF